MVSKASFHLQQGREAPSYRAREERVKNAKRVDESSAERYFIKQMNKLRVKSFKPVLKAIARLSLPAYRVQRASTAPDLSAAVSDPIWQLAEVAEISHFHPESSTHRPKALARALHHTAGISVRFDVADQYVRAVQTGYQSRVSRDSCVEFFVQPPGAGYFNFEINCGGTLLLFYIEDATKPRGTNGGFFKKYIELPTAHLKLVKIAHSLPDIVDPEIKRKVNWSLSFFAPWKLFEEYVPGGKLDFDQPWRGNFYKCGDETSHPHWASWSPIGDILRFHQPDRFGILEFEGRPMPSGGRRR